MDGVPLDTLVARILPMSPCDYRVAADDSEREVAYRLRGSHLDLIEDDGRLVQSTDVASRCVAA